jgi:hypothetical protein
MLTNMVNNPHRSLLPVTVNNHNDLTNIGHYRTTIGGVLKWGYAPIIQNYAILVLKPRVVGYPHFRKPPILQCSMLLRAFFVT